MKRGLREELTEKFKPWELKLLYNSYDIIGDIAVIRVSEPLEHRVHDIAETVMQINKHVKTVVHQVSPVSGNLRLRELRWVAGEKKTETVHKEHGCIFKVDLEYCYFSPRLLYERRRIAQQTGRDEIVNMFSGVGCFSIIIAKHSKVKKVHSIDINPVAIENQSENIRLNKVENVVHPILGDAKEVIKKRLRNVADRVLMPLPEKAYDYLDDAILALKPGSSWVHYYDFEHAARNEEPIEKVKDKVSEKLRGLNLRFDIPSARIVRTVGPRWFQIVLDILAHKKC